MSLYTEMLAAGLVTGSYQSDLYVKDCPEAWAIYERYKEVMAKPTRFRDNITGQPSLDFFANYEPYWEKRNA